MTGAAIKTHTGDFKLQNVCDLDVYAQISSTGFSNIFTNAVICNQLWNPKVPSLVVFQDLQMRGLSSVSLREHFWLPQDRCDVLVNPSSELWV